MRYEKTWEDMRCEKWEDVRSEKMSDVRRCQMWEDVRCEKMSDVRRCQMWEDVRRCEKMSDVRGCEKMWDVRRCEKMSDVRRCQMWEDVRRCQMWEVVRRYHMWEDLLYVDLFTPPSFWKTLRSDALGKKGFLTRTLKVIKNAACSFGSLLAVFATQLNGRRLLASRWMAVMAVNRTFFFTGVFAFQNYEPRLNFAPWVRPFQSNWPPANRTSLLTPAAPSPTAE